MTVTVIGLCNGMLTRWLFAQENMSDVPNASFTAAIAAHAAAAEKLLAKRKREEQVFFAPNTEVCGICSSLPFDGLLYSCDARSDHLVCMACIKKRRTINYGRDLCYYCFFNANTTGRDSSSTFTATAESKALSKFPVRCTLCSWEGTFGEWACHEQKTCKDMPVLCVACGESVARKDMAAHYQAMPRHEDLVVEKLKDVICSVEAEIKGRYDTCLEKTEARHSRACELRVYAGRRKITVDAEEDTKRMVLFNEHAKNYIVKAGPRIPLDVPDIMCLMYKEALAGPFEACSNLSSSTLRDELQKMPAQRFRRIRFELEVSIVRLEHITKLWSEGEELVVPSHAQQLEEHAVNSTSDLSQWRTITGPKGLVAALESAAALGGVSVRDLVCDRLVPQLVAATEFKFWLEELAHLSHTSTDTTFKYVNSVLQTSMDVCPDFDARPMYPYHGPWRIAEFEVMTAWYEARDEFHEHVEREMQRVDTLLSHLEYFMPSGRTDDYNNDQVVVPNDDMDQMCKLMQRLYDATSFRDFYRNSKVELQRVYGSTAPNYSSTWRSVETRINYACFFFGIARPSQTYVTMKTDDDFRKEGYRSRAEQRAPADPVVIAIDDESAVDDNADDGNDSESSSGYAPRQQQSPPPSPQQPPSPSPPPSQPQQQQVPRGRAVRSRRQ